MSVFNLILDCFFFRLYLMGKNCPVQYTLQHHIDQVLLLSCFYQSKYFYMISMIRYFISIINVFRILVVTIILLYQLFFIDSPTFFCNLPQFFQIKIQVILKFYLIQLLICDCDYYFHYVNSFTNMYQCKEFIRQFEKYHYYLFSSNQFC